MAKKKISRNEPCPCGSGKKYKKCCLRKQDAAPKKQSQRTKHWDLDEVRGFTTKRIIEKLQEFGVPFEED